MKAERVANVNILHDQSLSQRENIQVREEVRVELQALKDKEGEQLRNIHKLEKNRLENELNKREHELRDKKEELARLLVQYKALEATAAQKRKANAGPPWRQKSFSRKISSTPSIDDIDIHHILAYPILPPISISPLLHKDDCFFGVGDMQ